MREKVLEILMEINDEVGDYQGENLLEDEVITSLEVAEIVTALEDEFDITIAARHINKDNFASVDSVCRLVESLKA